MRAGAVTGIVEVTGDTPRIQTTASTLGNLVNQQTIESMPLNGRTWDQLALLQTVSSRIAVARRRALA